MSTLTFSEIEEIAHCAEHSFFMAGCGNCAVSELFRIESDKQVHLTKVSSIHPLTIEPRNPSPKTQLIQQQMTRMLAVFFAGAKVDAATAAAKEAKKLFKTTEDEKKIVLAAYLAIVWDDIVTNTASALIAAYQAGVTDALIQLSITEEELQTELDKIGETYGYQRSAEMIGKKYVDNKLVDNAQARYVIAETTKDDLQDIVEDAVSKKLTPSELEEQIKTAGTFSDLRAQFIAKNEIAVAQTAGHLEAWKRSSKVLKVNVVLGPLHVVTDECDAHANGGPYSIHECPIIPAHPNCACSLEAVEVLE